MRFLDLKKNLKKDFSSRKKLKLALLGDTATQFFSQALRGYGYEAGFDIQILEAGYNQIDRQIRDTASDLHAFHPDFILLFQASQKMLDRFYLLDNAGKSLFSKDRMGELSTWVSALNAGAARRTIICMNFAEIDDSVYGNFANKTDISFLYQLRKLNVELMDLAGRVANLFICDVSSLQNRFGTGALFDARLYADADMIFSLDFLPHAAKSVVDVISAVSGNVKKCLIMDLDNTLWGGIIGDDGMENIQIGDLGQGRAFSELQRWVKQLRLRGVLLAVCSKNDPHVAREPFEKHPDMVLSLDDIAVFSASWDSKIDSLRYIRSVLNIGYDSMVFLDDSVFERNLVRTHFPEVTVPELPEDPADYVSYLRSLNLFETGSLAGEDSLRTGHLQTEARRMDVRRTFTNEDDFLRNLGMVCEAGRVDTFTVPRAAQLTQRSNQFNVRTMRYTEKDIEHFAADAGYLPIVFSLRDKYGDYGLISLVIGCLEKDSLFIDTWIMSCRVLGRGVEFFVLNTLVAAAKERGCSSITGEYIPTQKNGLVKDHYRNLGFSDAGNNRWVLDVAAYRNRAHYINQADFHG